MPVVNTNDGPPTLYKDWVTGQPIVSSHGWPLTADAWDDQMFFLANHGYRCIAHDRRSHGRSDQSWYGNEMDTYADDLAALTAHLDLSDAIYVASAVAAFYFNVLVGIVQAFLKIPVLQKSSPTQTELPFAVSQLAVLLVFIALGIAASRMFRPVTQANSRLSC